MGLTIMTKPVKKRTFPPMIGILLFSAVTIALCLDSILSEDFSMGSLRYNAHFILLLALLSFLYFAQHVSIDDRNITIRLLWVPLKKIPLSHVKQVVFVPFWKDGKADTHHPMVLITLIGTGRFTYDTNPMFHSMRHPIRTKLIHLKKGHEAEMIDFLNAVFPAEVLEISATQAEVDQHRRK